MPADKPPDANYQYIQRAGEGSFANYRPKLTHERGVWKKDLLPVEALGF